MSKPNPFLEMPFPGAGGAYRVEGNKLLPDDPASAARRAERAAAKQANATAPTRESTKPATSRKSRQE